MAKVLAPLRSLYSARATGVDVVDVPELALLAVDGSGAPGDPAFADAIQSLYAVSYAAHFLAKKLGEETTVMPLEALWWTQDRAAQAFLEDVARGEAELTDSGDRSSWRWRAFIVQPEPIDEPLVVEALDQAVMRRGPLPATVRFERWAEGPAMQTLHVGPYSAEGPSIVRLHQAITAAGYRPRGRHHEIYLGDPRRAAPEKLRTILRHPVEPA